jgi:hypothetical protein
LGSGELLPLTLRGPGELLRGLGLVGAVADLERCLPKGGRSEDHAGERFPASARLLPLGVALQRDPFRGVVKGCRRPAVRLLKKFCRDLW